MARHKNRKCAEFFLFCFWTTSGHTKRSLCIVVFCMVRCSGLHGVYSWRCRIGFVWLCVGHLLALHSRTANQVGPIWPGGLVVWLCTRPSWESCSGKLCACRQAAGLVHLSWLATRGGCMALTASCGSIVVQAGCPNVCRQVACEPAIRLGRASVCAHSNLNWTAHLVLWRRSICWMHAAT